MRGESYWFKRGRADRQAGKSRHYAAGHLRSFVSRDAYQRGWDTAGAPSFEEIHEHGAREFGGLWILVNQEMVDAGRLAGLAYQEEPAKTALSYAAYRVLVALYEFHWIETRSPWGEPNAEPGGLFITTKPKEKVP